MGVGRSFYLRQPRRGGILKRNSSWWRRAQREAKQRIILLRSELDPPRQDPDGNRAVFSIIHRPIIILRRLKKIEVKFAPGIQIDGIALCRLAGGANLNGKLDPNGASEQVSIHLLAEGPQDRHRNSAKRKAGRWIR